MQARFSRQHARRSERRGGRLLPLFIGGILATLLLGGCATALDKRLAAVHTIEDARRYFGEPTSRAVQGNALRYEWAVLRPYVVPGQWVEREQYLGHDREGFPVYYRWLEFVPEHTVERGCRMTIMTDQTGVVTDTSWVGKGCNTLYGGP